MTSIPTSIGLRVQHIFNHRGSITGPHHLLPAQVLQILKCPFKSKNLDTEGEMHSQSLDSKRIINSSWASQSLTCVNRNNESVVSECLPFEMVWWFTKSSRGLNKNYWRLIIATKLPVQKKQSLCSSFLVTGKVHCSFLTDQYV